MQIPATALEFIQAHGKEIVSILAPIVSAIANRRKKAKLHYGIKHQFSYRIDELNDEGQVQVRLLNVRSLWVHNSGKESATRLEILLNHPGGFLNIWPPRHHERRIEHDQRMTILIENLTPDEGVSIEMATVDVELPAVLSVRCDQIVAERIDYSLHPAVPRWRSRLYITLRILGVATLAYLSLTLLEFAIR